MHTRWPALLGVLFAFVAATAANEQPLTPEQARKRVGDKVTVEIPVKAAKNRLEKWKEIYLDSEENFKDEKNFAAIITKAGADRFADQGIADPAEHIRGKTIRVTGTGTVKDDVPRIEVDDPKQIQLVDKKGVSGR